MVWLYVLVTVAMGMLLALQAGINAELRRWVGGPLRATFVSVLFSFTLAGLTLVATSLAQRRPWPSGHHLASAPWWVWIGGILGAVYVAATVMLVPRLGAFAFIALVVVGQMLASLLLDHFGLVGLARQPITAGRALGAVFLVIGVVLIRRV
jgi:transporter family-2 protein